MTEKTAHPVCDLRDAGLLDILEALDDVERQEDAACRFLVHPRSYLAERGLLIPSDVSISAVPTEEMRLRLLTPSRLDRIILTAQSDVSLIKIHVKDGLAKCVRIEFECPKRKKKGGSGSNSGTRDIARSLGLREFASIVEEVETDDDATDMLLASPRRFFESRGLLAGANVRFRTYRTDDWRKTLTDELSVDHHLDRQAAGSFDVHIKKGKGKCTTVTIECDK